MASDWPTVTIGDVAKIKHGFAFKGEFFTDKATPNVLLTPGNFVIGGGFQIGKPKYYAGPLPDGYALAEGEVVVTMTDLSKASDTLGYAAKVPTTPDVTYWHNQRIGLLQVKDEQRVCKDWLHYLMRTREYRAWIVGSASGTTVKHTSPSRIESFSFKLPTLKEQRTIAEILGAFDDRIDNLRQINATLEAMTQALFKSWFVDFDGVPPEEMQASELGLIPKGWRVVSLSDTLEIIGGGTPKTSVSEYWDGHIPWFSVVDTPMASNVFVTTTEKNITQAGLNQSSARLIPKGTTIISARGTVGNLAIAGCDMTFNQSCYGLRGKNGAGDYFVFLTAQRMVNQLKSMAHGSVFSTITRQTFNAIRVAAPPEEFLQKFEQSASVWFDKILLNVQQSRTLTQLRDTLLPKLLSGTISIRHEN